MLGKSRLGPLLPSLLLLRDKSKHHLLQAVSVERGRLCTLQGWLLRLAVVVKVSKNVEFKASQALVKLISYQVLTVRSWAFNWPLFKTEIGQARWRPPTGYTEGRINTGIMVAVPPVFTPKPYSSVFPLMSLMRPEPLSLRGRPGNNYWDVKTLLSVK